MKAMMRAGTTKLALHSILQVILSILAVGAVSAVGNNERLLEKVVEWERAALNREVAALTLQTRAEELLELARQLRERDYVSEKERKSCLNSAGDNAGQSGGIEGRASGNFDKAADNWEKVAAKYRKFGDGEKQHNAVAMAEAARMNALLACRRAAAAYETAAETYAVGNADQLDKAASANEQAASYREKLARRK